MSDMKSLSKEEVDKAYEGKCPKCDSRLVDGPEGGTAINVLCTNKECGAVIWAVPGVRQWTKWATESKLVGAAV